LCVTCVSGGELGENILIGLACKWVTMCGAGGSRDALGQIS